MQPDLAVIDRWKGVAPYWEKHRETIRQLFAPVTQALVEDAGVGSGHAVLDVGTGPGEPALSVAPLAGPKGRVVGIDPVPEMVAAARRAAERGGTGNVRFEVASADELPFPAGSFDAAISRFGAMFFPAPAVAIREILRVLRPGGKLALAVWDLAERNPFFYSLSRVIDRYVDSPPPAPDAPDAFRFAAPGRLRDILAGAGARAASERELHFTIEARMPVEEFWTLRSEISEQLRHKLATLSGEQLTEVRREALEAFREYSRDGRMSFPAQVLIVSGTKDA